MQSHQLPSHESLPFIRHLLDADSLKQLFAAPGDLLLVADVAALRQFKTDLDNSTIDDFYALIVANHALVELEQKNINMRAHEEFIHLFLGNADLKERYLKANHNLEVKWPAIQKYIRVPACWLPHFLDKAKLVEDILLALTSEQLTYFSVSVKKFNELLAIVRVEKEILRLSIIARLTLSFEEQSLNPGMVKDILIDSVNQVMKSMGAVHQTLPPEAMVDTSIDKAHLLRALASINVRSDVSLAEMHHELLAFNHVESRARVTKNLALSAVQIEIFNRLNVDELNFHIYESVATMKSEDRVFFAKILLSKHFPSLPYKKLFVDIVGHQPILITYFVQFNLFLQSFVQLAGLESFQPLLDAFNSGVIVLNQESFAELSKLLEVCYQRLQDSNRFELEEMITGIDSIDTLRQVNIYLTSLQSPPVMEEQPVPVSVPVKSPTFFQRHPWVEWAIIGAVLAAVIILSVLSYGGFAPVVGAAAVIGVSAGLSSAAAIGVGMTVICVAALTVGAVLLGGLRALVGKVTGKKLAHKSPSGEGFRSSPVLIRRSLAESYGSDVVAISRKSTPDLEQGEQALQRENLTQIDVPGSMTANAPVFNLDDKGKEDEFKSVSGVRQFG